MKKIIIIGATSGIGRAIAERYAAMGCRVGITGRRAELLEEIRANYPANVYIQPMDVCDVRAADKLQELITAMEGMDTLFINSGYGKATEELIPEIELQTVQTNAVGFTQLIIFGYNYFKAQHRAGHIVVTSSVASVRALRQSPAYSSTKRYIRHYVDCLAQREHHEKLDIKFTTLMPGFIATDFLADYNYPLIVPLQAVVDNIFNAIDKQRRAVYLPFRWNFVVFLWRLLPKWIWERWF